MDLKTVNTRKEEAIVTFRAKIHEYWTSTRWTEKHRGILSSTDKPSIEIACPPEFGGEAGYWTPEDLFVSAVEVCLMTTFLAITERRNLKIWSYQSTAVGRACMVDKTFRFSEVEISPRIVVPPETSKEEILKAIERAKEKCLVSCSLVTKVSLKATII